MSLEAHLKLYLSTLKCSLCGTEKKWKWGTEIYGENNAILYKQKKLVTVYQKKTGYSNWKKIANKFAS